MAARRRDRGDWITLEEAAGLLRVEEHQVRLLAGQGFLVERRGEDGEHLYEYRTLARMQAQELLRELREAIAPISPELAMKVDTLALVQFARGRFEGAAPAIRETVVSLQRESA
jgi:hypothetical protein